VVDPKPLIHNHDGDVIIIIDDPVLEPLMNCHVLPPRVEGEV
jgi:hypothetical protein